VKPFYTTKITGLVFQLTATESHGKNDGRLESRLCL